MIKKTKYERVDYHLTVDQHNRLRALAERTCLSVAAHIRLAVDKYLKGKESK